MGNDRKKILMLITNLGKGGAQRVFYDHAQYLRNHYHVSEAVFDIREDMRIYDSGLELFSFDVRASTNPVGKVLNLFKRVRALRTLVREQNFPLVISHMDGANWINALAGKRHKKILVVHGTILHDHAMQKQVQQLRLKWLIPQLYKRADAVVAVSEGIKSELQRHCGLKNVVAIPNFFDVEAIQAMARLPLPGEWAAVFAFPTLVTSGRLHEQKKQRYLLPVFKALKKDFPDLKLVLLGDGELRDALIGEAAGLGLRVYSVWETGTPLSAEYDVYFPGYLDNPFRFLNKSTVFVFPSAWEGFPLALCEAMISGAPVLAADCPTGPREILAPGTEDTGYSLAAAAETPYGYLMPMPGKPTFTEEWIKAIRHLLEQPEKRAALVQEGSRRMLDYHRGEVLYRWQKLVQAVLSGGAA